MQLQIQTIATVALVLAGGAISTPVLVKGFTRRGTGVKYEKNFLIQRAPQFTTLLTVILIVFGNLSYGGVFGDAPPMVPIFALTGKADPSALVNAISWLGIAVLISGLVFMIGGWYSLGESFSTDAEVLEDHKVRSDGLLRFVMHPAYSGIIQSLLGASLAATSPIAVLCTVCVVAPLWLKRAKYEEALLIEALGQSYKDYAEQMKWRRLIPRFFPIGV